MYGAVPEEDPTKNGLMDGQTGQTDVIVHLSIIYREQHTPTFLKQGYNKNALI